MAKGPSKVGRSVAGWAVLQKTCDLAFFPLSQKVLLMSMMRYQNIIVAGNSGHIYGFPNPHPLPGTFPIIILAR